MANVVQPKDDKLEKMRLADAKLVKGKFICMEPKGGSVKFPFRKYKGDPVVHYDLQDGQTYELPKAVVKHLSQCGWEVHSHILDKQGNPIIGTGKKEYRFSFQSFDFF